MYHNTANVYIFVNPNAKEGTHAFDLKRKTRLVARTRRRDDGPTAERTDGRNERRRAPNSFARVSRTTEPARRTRDEDARAAESESESERLEGEISNA